MRIMKIIKTIISDIVEDVNRIDYRAWVIAYILGSIVLNFTAIVLVQEYLDLSYTVSKTSEYFSLRISLDKFLFMLYEVGFVFALCLGFAGGIVFMGALNWVGFGRKDKRDKNGS